MKSMTYLASAFALSSALAATPVLAQATNGKDPSPTPGSPNVYSQSGANSGTATNGKDPSPTPGSPNAYSQTRPSGGPAVNGKDPSYTGTTNGSTSATRGVPAGQNAAKKKTDTNNN